MLAKQLDFYNGLYGVITDEDDERKLLYGRAGAFRPKPYGIEYRVLSNFWLEKNVYMRRVFNGCKWAIKSLEGGVDNQLKDVQDIINNNEKDAAANLLVASGVIV